MRITKMLPFLDDESKAKLVEAILNEEITDIKLVQVYPFLNQVATDDIFAKYLSKEYNIEIMKLIPFLNENQVEALYQKVINQEITDIREEMLLPFLGKDKIKVLFNEFLNSHRNE